MGTSFARSTSKKVWPLIDRDASALSTAVGGRRAVAVYAEPVTEARRVELLPFPRERAVSITAHGGFDQRLIVSLAAPDRVMRVRLAVGAVGVGARAA